MRGYRKQTLLVLDAAYAEYVRRNDYEAGVELVSSFDNVVMLRTFSKVYGLAALRIGWAYCPPEVADALNRIRGAFNVSACGDRGSEGGARRSGACRARFSAQQQVDRAWLREEIERIGFKATPSVGNFLLVHFPPGEAPEADEFLSARGLVLRRMEVYDLPDALRLSVGSEEANLALLAALAEFAQRPRVAHG